MRSTQSSNTLKCGLLSDAVMHYTQQSLWITSTIICLTDSFPQTGYVLSAIHLRFLRMNLKISSMQTVFLDLTGGPLLYHLTLWPTNFYCYYPSLISICLNSVKSFISVSQLLMYTSTHVLLENRAGVSWSPYSTDSYFHDFVFAFVICVSFMANIKAGNMKNTAWKSARPCKTVLVLAWFQILSSQAS